VRFGCLDEYRRRKRRPEIPHDSVPDSAVFEDHMAGQFDPELEQALESLTRRHRTAVLLKHVSGLSGEEIAVVLGTTRRAAYAVVKRAETNLRARLGVSR
jgi:RNA polymerase sigma factor (sigma-70 family)